MKINQLFRKRVDVPTLLMLLRCFGLTSLKDQRSFCKADLAEMGTVAKILQMKEALEEVYMPCKGRVYLENMSEKRAVTVLKQVLRVHGYYLLSTERNFDNKKVIFYSLASELDVFQTPTMHSFQQTRIIEFV